MTILLLRSCLIIIIIIIITIIIIIIIITIINNYNSLTIIITSKNPNMVEIKLISYDTFLIFVLLSFMFVQRLVREYQDK